MVHDEVRSYWMSVITECNSSGMCKVSGLENIRLKKKDSITGSTVSNWNLVLLIQITVLLFHPTDLFSYQQLYYLPDLRILCLLLFVRMMFLSISMILFLMIC